MALTELLVQAAELLQAASELNTASETYKEAVESARSAANELEAKWEGAAKDAFHNHQENAYSWHTRMIEVIRKMVETIKKVVELYEQMESNVKNTVKG